MGFIAFIIAICYSLDWLSFETSVVWILAFIVCVGSESLEQVNNLFSKNKKG